jgi:hypothetical protein
LIEYPVRIKFFADKGSMPTDTSTSGGTSTKNIEKNSTKQTSSLEGIFSKVAGLLAIAKIIEPVLTLIGDLLTILFFKVFIPLAKLFKPLGDWLAKQQPQGPTTTAAGNTYTPGGALGPLDVDIWEKIKEWASNAGTWLKELWDWGLQNIKDTIANWGTIIGDVWNWGMDNIKETVSNWGIIIGDLWNKAMTNVDETISNWGIIIGDLWTKTMTSVDETLTTWKEDLSVIFAEWGEGLATWVDNIWNEYVSPAWESMLTFVENIWDNYMVPAWEKILTWGKDIFDKFIAPALSPLKDLLSSFYETIVKPAIDLLSRGVRLISDYISDLIKRFFKLGRKENEADTLQQQNKNQQETIDKQKEMIDDLIEQLREENGTRAFGGIIPEDGLYKLHAGEVVSRGNTINTNKQSNSIAITINGNATRDVVDEIITSLNKEMRGYMRW